MTEAVLKPVPVSARIEAIDAVRGFALLGIFLVNSEMFGDALGAWLKPGAARDGGPADAAGFYFLKVFCEGKFYPLFSMLFGMGLALQWRRAREAGREFLGTGFRRLGVLALIGLAHITLLWYGDVLLVYSIAGVVLLLMSRARPKTLAVTGSILIGVSVILSMALLGLMALADAPPAPAGPDAPPPAVAVGPAAGEPATAAPAEAAVPAEAAADKVAQGPAGNEKPVVAADNRPFERLIRALNEERATDGPMDPIWIAAEREAYSKGPMDQVLKFRFMTYVMYLVFGVMGFIWHMAGIFLLGAALLKSGVFEPERRDWHRRFVKLGVLVGLPAAVLAAAILEVFPDGPAQILIAPFVMIGGPFLSLGYLGAITLLVRSGRARRVTGALAKVGRMALTNYLMQTLIATSIFYYYGLGLFGQTTRVERFGLVLGVYLCQIVFSVVWLKFFRYGPMEWLWRSLTYLRPQPILCEGPVPTSA